MIVSLKGEPLVGDDTYNPHPYLVVGKLRDLGFEKILRLSKLACLLAIPSTSKEDNALIRRYMTVRGDIAISSINAYARMAPLDLSTSRIIIYAPSLLEVAKDMLMAAEESDEERRA